MILSVKLPSRAVASLLLTRVQMTTGQLLVLGAHISDEDVLKA